MKALRNISIGTHGAIEVLAAPLLFVAPFVLGFGYLAGALSIALGALLIGLAISIYGDSGARSTVPLTAHAGLDHVLAAIAIAIGLALLVTGQLAPGIFMVGFGTAHLALSASTRYTRPIGA